METPSTSIENLHEQIVQLNKQRTSQQQKDLTTDEQATKDRACMILGEMILSCFDGDWSIIDFGAMNHIIQKNKTVFTAHTAPKLPYEEARERLDHWETTKHWNDFS